MKLNKIKPLTPSLKPSSWLSSFCQIVYLIQHDASLAPVVMHFETFINNQSSFRAQIKYEINPFISKFVASKIMILWHLECSRFGSKENQLSCHDKRSFTEQPFCNDHSFVLNCVKFCWQNQMLIWIAISKLSTNAKNKSDNATKAWPIAVHQESRSKSWACKDSHGFSAFCVMIAGAKLLFHAAMRHMVQHQLCAFAK